MEEREDISGSLLRGVNDFQSARPGTRLPAGPSESKARHGTRVMSGVCSQ